MSRGGGGSGGEPPSYHIAVNTVDSGNGRARVFDSAAGGSSIRGFTVNGTMSPTNFASNTGRRCISEEGMAPMANALKSAQGVKVRVCRYNRGFARPGTARRCLFGLL